MVGRERESTEKAASNIRDLSQLDHTFLSEYF